MSDTNGSHNQQFSSFKEFYPFYLAEHQNVVSRRLHFTGTALVLALVVYILASGLWGFLLAVPVVGYGFAWIGHFFFEKNKPATFKYPLYSLLGDFVMFFDILRGKVSIRK
ncbi:hypothetical protein GCM10007094_36300 [Pseudovibrio japonicus]|uniref:Transmembrane protein n=1 Tax=Pseudovibrio japonicus TaxID=366534 RepID=A0ABQ3ELX1_9HYPH|nr:DUF962 domain-containing protein [Pseudovibrio japonicus]GHB43619.1 hypothetical protein GCM10007094_36300 [Pseudovibrio japonicus]